jgi:tripartite ATP-independent transporter DctP family solute receptor
MIVKRIALLLSAMFLVGAGPVEGDGFSCEPERDVVIRLATTFAPGHILVDTSERFKALVEAESKGNITVDLRPAAGTEDGINLETSMGIVDMQATGGPPLQVFAPAYFFFNGPYVIRDYDHFLRVWNGPLGDDAKQLVREAGNMVALDTVYRGFRQMTSKVPINGTADLVGLKLRLPTVPTWLKVWSSLETQPTAIPLPMLYESLRTGVVDASEGDLSQISSLRLYEVQSHLSLTNHLVGVGWFFVNEDFWQSLSHRQRRRIRQAMQEAAAFGTQKMQDSEASLLQSLQAAGMTVVMPDAAAIRAKARPAVDELFRTDWPVTTWDEVLAQ